MNALIAELFAAVNETLAAAIVIIAVSLLLYNLTRNRTNRVARASAAVLSCVTFAYICDVYLSLEPDPETAAAALRLQWIGIAFIPAALFHLSDALLATTGLPSRGRRRRVVRVLYLLSGVFLLLVGFTDVVVTTRTLDSGVVVLRGEALSVVFIAYFVTASVVTFINVQRARRRGLTPRSKRRMAYLQVAILMPGIGIFPYSILLSPTEVTLWTQLIVNIANVIIILMLIFLSYPLSFFGSDVPDRVVKVELLRFLLRGPATGLLALAGIIFTRRSIEILGLPGEDLMPFAVVTVVLFWQWLIDPLLPWLEKLLVYNDEDDQQLARLQELGDRILTHGDLTQLLEATMEAFGDYLRAETSFVLQLTNTQDLDMVKWIGSIPADNRISEDADDLLRLAQAADRVTDRSAFQQWQDYQIVPLYSKRVANGADPLVLIGIFGIAMTENPVTRLNNPEDITLIYTYVQRLEQTLDDLVLQSEIFAALEGLLPQINMTRARADEVEYRPGRTPPQPKILPKRDEIHEQVHAALKHYWGGPGMTRSRLLDLQIVQQQLAQVETPLQALRAVLQTAIDKQRPEGPQSMTAPEWTMYNILNQRFIERRKAKDVARRMSISESDLYRKQRLAIQTLADAILQMEREEMKT